MSIIKKYWAEIIVFGAIFGVLILCNLPGMTWMNTDSDGPHYILSAKYMGIAHNTSAPFFLLLGRLFLWLPLGSDAWRMGLISVLSTTACSVFIYQIVKYHLNNNTKAKWYALIASILYGGSALVISQSTIIESYALSTMLSVAAYYACLRNKWVLASVCLGLTLAVHPLFFIITWAILLVGYKQLRNWKCLLITYAFAVFYLYIPITQALSDVPAMWGNSTATGFIENNVGTILLLVGGLSLWDIPKRIFDTFGIMLVSMGFGLFITLWYFIKGRTFKSVLLWMTFFPAFFFAVNLAAETYVYMIPTCAYGAIVTGIALSKVNKKVVYATTVVAIGLMAFNANYFDIGRTLDPNLSAQRFYDEELPKMEDGDIYLGGGWTWAIVYLYNKEEGREIVPICTDILPSEEYLDIIESNGINLIRTDSDDFTDMQWEVAMSIAESNDNVWMSKETIPSQYQYEIVPASENTELITRWLGHKETTTVKWKPSNPYDFITGSIEVSEWKFILKTTHNARFALMWALYAYAIYWFAVSFIFKPKSKEVEDENPPSENKKSQT